MEIHGRGVLKTGPRFLCLLCSEQAKQTLPALKEGQCQLFQYTAGSRALNPHTEPRELWVNRIHVSLSHPSSVQDHHHEGSQGPPPAAQGQQLGFRHGMGNSQPKSPGHGSNEAQLEQCSAQTFGLSQALPQAQLWEASPVTFPAQVTEHTRGCTEVQSPMTEQDLISPPQPAPRQAQKTRAQSSSGASGWDAGVCPEIHYQAVHRGPGREAPPEPLGHCGVTAWLSNGTWGVLSWDSPAWAPGRGELAERLISCSHDLLLKLPIKWKYVKLKSFICLLLPFSSAMFLWTYTYLMLWNTDVCPEMRSDEAVGYIK